MWKGLLVILLLLSVVRCGKPAPAIEGIDLPPNDNLGQINNPSNISNFSPVSPEGGVKVFDAPLVLLRGEIPQYETPMNAAPGA